MPAKTALAARLRSPAVRIAGAVIALAAVAFLLLQQANVLLARSVAAAFGGATESTFRSARFEWDGDVVARDFVARPSGTGEQAAIRFERVHLETPGWFWFVRNSFDRQLRNAQLDRLHLTLEGGQVDAGIDPTLGALGPFGAVSASPFEAEGCLSDASFLRDSLVEMGLKPEPTRLEFDFHAKASELDTRIVLETRRASRVQLDRRERLPGEVNALSLGSVVGDVLSERWEVQDQGFVSARNRFCAKKDGTDARRFIDRHVDSMERLLATRGVGLGAEARIAYRRFARDGGTLVFGGDYQPPLPAAESSALRSSGESLARMSPVLNYNGRAYPVQWSRFPPRPLAGLEEGAPTFALLQRERMQPAPAPGESSAAPAGNANSAAADDVPASPDATIAGAEPVAADTQTPASTPAPEQNIAAVPVEPPAVQPPAAAAAAADPAAPEVAERTAAAAAEPAAEIPDVAASATGQPEGAPETTATAAVAPPPAPVAAPPPRDPAIAARIKAPSSGPAAATAPRGPRAGAKLEWEALATLRGRTVRIWTVHAPPRTVEILSADGDSLRVAVRLGGGNAEFTIQRQGFLRATLIR